MSTPMAMITTIMGMTILTTTVITILTGTITITTTTGMATATIMAGRRWWNWSRTSCIAISYWLSATGAILQPKICWPLIW